MMNHSRFGRYVNSVFSNVYQALDVISIVMHAVVLRIDVVQLREPSRSYMYLTQLVSLFNFFLMILYKMK